MQTLDKTAFLTGLVPGSAAALGMVRAGVHGVFLFSVLTSSFAALGDLPVTILRPPGILSFLSWKFFDWLITPSGMTMLKAALVVSLLMSTLGYLTSFSTKTSAVLVILYQGLLRGFGHLNADEMTGIYFLIVLAFTPCGEGFSLDSLFQKQQGRERWAYAYPIFLMQLLMSWCYFTAGWAKLRISGLAYFGRDNLPIQAIDHSLGNLHDTQFRLAFYLPQFRDLMGIAIVVAIVWEILFPLAVFSRRARPWLLGFGIVFHITTLLTMNIFFSNMLAMYLVFVDWPAVARWLSRKPLFRDLSTWWTDFRMPPEVFPDVKVEAISSNTLLWDGDCSFCSYMVGRFRRWARRPLRDRSFQHVEKYLPQQVRKWANSQMLWVSADGSVVGGSRALVEVLDTIGYRWLAAALESRPLRPFTWIGYRLVARNRSFFSAKTGARCAVNS